jgi:hypothetical protein
MGPSSGHLVVQGLVSHWSGGLQRVPNSVMELPFLERSVAPCWFLNLGFKSIDKFATLGCGLARALSGPIKCVRFVVAS